MANDIREWLSALALEEHIDAFIENGVDMTLLPELTNDDLKDLGVARLADRKRIVKAIVEPSTNSEIRAALSENRPSEPSAPSDAERRHLTVMFVDLVGSTEMAARVDPEDMREVITVYQNTVAGVVARYEGFVAKFMGDGVLCYFGWPRANEDDAERAVHAGLDIISTVKNIAGPEEVLLASRVGIASGIVIVGDLIGSGATQEAAVVGETPNLAARLQGLAEPNQLVVPKETLSLLGNAFELEPLGGHALKGITELVDAYVVVGDATRESRFDARQSGTLNPIVGREQELGLMRECWAKAKAGSGQMILISGEAGIGKSRIARAVIDDVAQDDHVRMTYQCSPYHTESAFYPIIQQMSFAAGIKATDGADARLDKLEALIGSDAETTNLIASMLGIDTSARYGALELSPAQQRARTMQAVVRLLVQQAEAKPLLLVFEDLHWIDPTSLELLELALNAVSEQNILILGTARPIFEYGFGGHPIVNRFALNRLRKEEVVSIVAKLTGGKALPDEVMQIIASRTDGVPLFVEELTKTILESGVLKEDGNRLVLDSPLNALAIPSTLHDSLMARLDRLQPIKEVAQTAACIGREFDHHLLASISPLREDELNIALEGLIKAELIYRRGVPPEASYLFKHALVRDAAYESLLKERRRAIHNRILVALENEADVANEILAYHAETAGLADRAIDYFLKAGQRSMLMSANAEAIAHLSKGLEILSTLPVDAERARRELDFLTAIGPALVASKGYAAPDVETVYRRALELCQELGDVAKQFSTIQGLSLYHFLGANLRVSRDLAQQLVELAKSRQDPGPDLAADRALGYALHFLGELDAARLCYERVINSYDIAVHGSYAFRHSGSDFGVGVFAMNGMANFVLGYPDQAKDHGAQSLALARELKHPISETFARWNLGLIHQLRGEPTAVQEQVETGTLIAEEKGFVQYVAWMKVLRNWALFERKGSAEAVAGMHEGIEDNRAIGSNLLVPHWLSLLASAYGRTDRAEEGLVIIAEAQAEIARTDERLWEAELHRVKGQLLLKCNTANEAEAEVCFHDAIEVARSQKAKSWELRAITSLAGLWMVQGKHLEAYDLLATIYGWFTEGLDTPDLIAAKALLNNLK